MYLPWFYGHTGYPAGRFGQARGFWKLADGRCKKKFGWFTDTSITGFSYGRQDLLELLWWFELEWGIARRLQAPYHRYIASSGASGGACRPSDDQIRILEDQVEVERPTLGRALNRRHSDRKRLQGQGERASTAGLGDLSAPRRNRLR